MLQLIIRTAAQNEQRNHNLVFAPRFTIPRKNEEMVDAEEEEEEGEAEVVAEEEEEEESEHNEETKEKTHLGIKARIR